jgi:uncharacterized protein (DUF488 family)
MGAVGLLTVGHGTLAADELVELLRGAGVRLLVDVRAYPGSRRHPQFGREALAGRLPDEGIEYRWEPRLGGRRSTRPDSPNVALRNDAFRAYADHMATTEFARALDDVLHEAARRTTAVMCAESVWWRCHRRLLADAAVLTRDAEVRHLLHDGRLAPHHLTDGARLVREGSESDDRAGLDELGRRAPGRDRHVVYDVGGDQPLPFR